MEGGGGGGSSNTSFRSHAVTDDAVSVYLMRLKAHWMVCAWVGGWMSRWMSWLMGGWMDG